MINILSWNCRGAGAGYFPRLVRELKHNYNIHVLVIVEPRVSGQIIDSIIDKLGFQNIFRVEAVGFSGGIWLLWDGDSVEIDIISTSSQLIHSYVTVRDGKESFFLICVYGSPTPTVRHELWSQLANLSNSMGNQRWSCIGDVNTYKGVEDKQGVLDQTLEL